MTRLSLRELTGTEGPFGRGMSVIRPSEVSEDAVVTVFRVPPEAAGMRLDRFIQSQLKRTSRTRTQKIVERSAFSPEGKALRPSDRVRGEQCILLWRPPWDEQTPDVELPILYEDEHLLAINKPPQIAVHPTARHHKGTVVKMLEKLRGGERLMLAHRIDRETSGVLLISRTPLADRLVKKQFERGANAPGDPRAGARPSQQVEKQYIAIVWGYAGEDRFRVEKAMELDPHSRIGVKMRLSAPGEGLYAATQFEVLERRAHPQTQRPYSLLRCMLETGRQHQIRLHLASLGLPIVGDKLYGPDEEMFARSSDGVLTDEDRRLLELDRHALHAASLELDHPIREERIRIEAPLTADLQSFWDSLEPLQKR